MNRPVHFEIQSPDTDKTKAFFSTLFGWTFTTWGGSEEYFPVVTGESEPGINGGLMASPDGQARTINVIQVEDLDATVAQITAEGGQIALPRMTVPGVGYVAYGLDPTGFLFGVVEFDQNAKLEEGAA